MRRVALAALAVGGAALCAAAAPAAAEPGRLADFSLRLTSTAPDSPTGMSVDLLFHRADDPDAKPSPLRSAVIRGPQGLRFDTGAVRECTATDEELRVLGSAACPSESELAVGPFSAMSGFGPPADPTSADNHVFNGPSQLIEVITFHDSSISPAFDRLTIEGSTLTAHPPRAPGGPPEGEMSVRSIAYTIPVRGTGERTLIRTPPACPATGFWTTTGTFGFADGTSDSVTTRTRCRERRPRRRALRVAVAPRRVQAGRRTRLRFRVRSSLAACVAGARVRVAGRRTRTDARGRASLATTFSHTGIRRVRAASAGCSSATTPLRILP